MSNNYFLNAYKKNSPKPEDMEVTKEKTVKPFVFEKVPTTQPQDKLEEKIEKKVADNEEPVSKVKLSAIFFILSGIDKAASILKSFNYDEINKIAKEIMKVLSITENELKLVEKQFGPLNISDLKSYTGGKEFVRQLFQKLFGLSDGSEKFVKIVEESQKEEIKYLEKLSSEQAMTLLSGESDLIFSSILTLLPPQTAAGVIKSLQPERSVSIIRMLSSKTAVNSDIKKMIVTKLNEKAKEIIINEEFKVQGTKKLIDIIKNSDSDITDRIISSIERDDPALANTLKEAIFTFNDIIKMPRKSLEYVMKNYDNKEIAYILKGSSDEVKAVYLTCVTTRRKELIINEIELLGQVKKSDVDEKRKTFVSFIKKLEEDGTIVVRDDKDIYVN